MNPTELAASLKCLGNKLINVTGEALIAQRKQAQEVQDKLQAFETARELTGPGTLGKDHIIN